MKHHPYILFPPVAVLICLLPLAAGLLIYSMLTLEETAPLRIASYVIAFYTLTVWCIRVPAIYRRALSIKNNDRYVRRWLDDAQLRMNVTLGGSAVWNSAYAVLQLSLGIHHSSAWFYALAVYYTTLAVMRSSLMHHTVRHRPGEKRHDELIRYRVCGIIFLITNIALSVMMFQMIVEGRTVLHHEITTIAMAAYTFTALTMSIVNVIRYKRYNSPAMSASKAISLASACVSMLTLENTMLSTFGTDMTPTVRRLFLSLSGGAISCFIIVMAIYMIVQSSKRLREENMG